MRRRNIASLINSGIPDENLIYDNTNITAQFPNANNTGIDSTGNVLTATTGGEAISILKTQDVGQSDFVAIVAPFEGEYEFANISNSDTASDTKYTADHTGFTSSTGTVSPSPFSIAGYETWKAFDGTTGTVNIQSTTTQFELVYDFNSPISLYEYKITGATNPGRSPKDWRIEGSNTGTFNGEEVVLDTKTGITWSISETKIFTLPSESLPFAYLRLRVTSNGGGSNTQVKELEYFKVVKGSTANTLITSTPIVDGDNVAIVKDDDSVNEIVASGVVDNSTSTVDTNDIFGDGSIIDTYQFNGDKTSLSGTNDGTGSLNTYGAGQFGQGGVFDATYSQMVTPINQSNISTISVWVKITTAGTHYIIGNNVASSTAGDMQIIFKDTSVSCNLHNIDAYSLSESHNLDEWYHVVATTDGTSASIWVNSILLDSRVGTYVQAVDTIAFGQDRSISGSYGGNQIDQARFFNRELTQEEITMLYAENIPQYQLDTTATTAGEIPSRVYLVDTKASFELSGGFVEAEIDSDSYDITASPILKTTRTYKDLIDPIGSQTVRTKVEMTKGNKATKIIGTLNKRN